MTKKDEMIQEFLERNPVVRVQEVPNPVSVILSAIPEDPPTVQIGARMETLEQGSLEIAAGEDALALRMGMLHHEVVALFEEAALVSSINWALETGPTTAFTENELKYVRQHADRAGAVLATLPNILGDRLSLTHNGRTAVISTQPLAQTVHSGTLKVPSTPHTLIGISHPGQQETLLTYPRNPDGWKEALAHLWSQPGSGEPSAG